MSRLQSAPRCKCRLELEPLEDRLLLNGDMVIRWNDVLLDALRADTTRPGPTWASRNMAIVHGAIYDAVNGINPSHQPYIFGLPRAPRGASADAAVAAAGHWTLRSLYPAQRATFDAAFQASLADIPDGQAETAGVHWGRFVAGVLLAIRQFDGSTLPMPYRSSTLPGRWRPTPPDFTSALTPGWGRVRPFALFRGSQFRPPPPPALTSAQYTAAFHEVKSLGDLHSTTRTADQTEIGVFWAYDRSGFGTPPVLYDQIVQTIAEDMGNTMQENARLFALVNFAMADAGVVSWDAKYVYNFWRPVSAIRAAGTDGNPNTMADASWTPLSDDINGFTPPFPAYTSGHSTFGAAMFRVLANFYGTDSVNFTIGSDELPGVFRSYASFSQASAENGLSRIYLGIHWNFDNNFGQSTGRAIADFVTRHFLLPRFFAHSARDAGAAGASRVGEDAPLLLLMTGCDLTSAGTAAMPSRAVMRVPKSIPMADTTASPGGLAKATGLCEVRHEELSPSVQEMALDMLFGSPAPWREPFGLDRGWL